MSIDARPRFIEMCLNRCLQTSGLDALTCASRHAYWRMSNERAAHVYSCVMSHVTYEWVVMTCHIWMSHVLWFVWHMNESRHIPTSHEPRIWIRHVLSIISHTNQLCVMSCVTYEWVMQMNESWHISMRHAYEWGMCNESYDIRISHAHE